MEGEIAHGLTNARISQKEKAFAFIEVKNYKRTSKGSCHHFHFQQRLIPLFPNSSLVIISTKSTLTKRTQIKVIHTNIHTPSTLLRRPALIFRLHDSPERSRLDMLECGNVPISSASYVLWIDKQFSSLIATTIHILGNWIVFRYLRFLTERRKKL